MSLLKRHMSKIFSPKRRTSKFFTLDKSRLGDSKSRVIIFCRCQAVGPAIDEKEDTETYDIGQVFAEII